MTQDPGANSFENAAHEPGLMHLLLSAINGSENRQQLVTACLDVVARLLPFEFAFCLSKRTSPPWGVVTEAHNVPPTFAHFFERSDFANSSGSLSAQQDPPLQALVGAVREASPEGLIPLLVPLMARGQTTGVLVLLLRPEYVAVSDRYSDWFDLIGQEIGIALERIEELMQLRTQQERHRAFMENSPDGFWETDENYVVRFANAAALRIIALPPDQVLGKQLNHLSSTDSRLTL
jgi:PAS domain-containing protein